MAAQIEIRPVSGSIGAEIAGVDLGSDLSNEAFDTVHQAFLDHKVIFFRGQHTLTPERHKAFGRRFGSLNVHPYVAGMKDHPEIMEIIKEPDEKTNFGGGWHTDMSFLQKPAIGSILHAIEVPPFGGDTLFANQTAAYEALSDGVKETLSKLTAIHSAKGEYGPKGQSALNRKSMATQAAPDAPEFEHPVVRTHPETGAKGLYVNPAFTLRFAGWTRSESRPLLNYLFEHSRKEQFTCRFRWETGSVAFWDNRCTWHFALNDYPGKRRHMRRVTVNGDKPF
jgi:taurine dioxygenase